VQGPERELHEIKKGQAGRVRSLTAEGTLRRRLLDLGFTPGGVVENIRSAPLGDPTAYSVRGATIALRKEEARHIRVIPASAPGRERLQWA
jgi:ferrous iron transport protein A